MGRKRSEGEFAGSAGELHERLWSWRREAPGGQFRRDHGKGSERERLMKPLVEELVTEAGAVEVDELCPECGGRAQNKGKKKRVIRHREGEVEVKRNHYYCPSCKQGFFPPGSGFGVEQTGMESVDAEDGVAPGG